MYTHNIRLMLTDKPANMSENLSHVAHDDQTAFTIRLLKNGKLFRCAGLLY